MQFVRNSYYENEIPEPWDSQGILEYIERIGRLCYRSEEKITEGSAAKFIEMLKERKHYAMLEHYIFTISIPEWIFNSILDLKLFTPENMDYWNLLKYVNITKWEESPSSRLKYLISGSATAFNNLCACPCVKDNPGHGLNNVYSFLSNAHPHVIAERDSDGNIHPAYMRSHYDPFITFLWRDEVKKLPKNLRKYHDWFSVHFIVERSSTHDLVRHRPSSYSQESTRYCNYDKKGLCFIIPVQFNEIDKRILESETMVTQTLLHPIENPYKLSDVALEWLLDIRAEADNYIELLNTYHMTPQEAKSVIPHALKAEINITTFKQEWTHIFKMRADKAAFPQIQEVMVPLLNDHIKDDPEIFGHLQHLVEEGSQYVKP